MTTPIYPTRWPKKNPKKPGSLVSRITEQQKEDLFNRVITTRELAKTLGVHEKYLSFAFPGKVEIFDKKPLVEARRTYRLAVALDIMAGKLSTKEAAALVHVSYNTMQRYINKAKIKFPEESKRLIEETQARKKLTKRHNQQEEVENV